MKKLLIILALAGLLISQVANHTEQIVKNDGTPHFEIDTTGGAGSAVAETSKAINIAGFKRFTLQAEIFYYNDSDSIGYSVGTQQKLEGSTNWGYALTPINTWDTTLIIRNLSDIINSDSIRFIISTTDSTIDAQADYGHFYLHMATE